MPRDANGTYSLPPGNPVVSGTLVSSDWANPTMGDLGLEMSDSLSRSGKGGMSAAFRAINGSALEPSMTFINDILTGRYLTVAGQMRDTVLGADVMIYRADSVSPNVQLQCPNGSEAAPSISFNAAPTSGRRLDGSGAMRDVVNGVDKLVYATGALFPLVPVAIIDGTVTLPGLNFANEQSSGRYRSGAADYRESVLGLDKMRFLATGVEVFLGGAWHLIDPRLAGGESRNLLINGAFDVWQRGTSGFTTGYTADRWNHPAGLSAISRREFGGAQRSRYGIFLSRTVVGQGILEQRIEASDAAKVGGQPLTLSFNHDPLGGVNVTSIDCILRVPNVTDDFSATQVIEVVTVFPTGANNEALEAVFAAVPSTVRRGLAIQLQYNVTDASNWSLAEVQLEVGTTKVEFERLPVATILEKCQRYYERWSHADGDRALPFTSITVSTTTGVSYVQFSVEKRAIPTIVINSILDWEAIVFGGVPFDLLAMAESNTSTRSVRLDWTSAVQTAGGGALIAFDTGGSLTIDAEL